MAPAARRAAFMIGADVWAWAAFMWLLEKGKAVPLEFTRLPAHLLGKHSVLPWR